MGGRLIRDYLPGHGIRFALCQCADLCNEAADRHQADWISAWLLSEALVCASLLSVTLKDTERLTLRWEYPGPAGTILADADHTGSVRGFLQRLNLAIYARTLEEALGGTGRMSAITSVPNRVLHTGLTEGVFQDIPQDMAHLFSLSYQLETVLTAGLIIPLEEQVRVNSALGVMLQPLPGADMNIFGRMRDLIDDPDFRAWLEEQPRHLEDVPVRLSGRGGEWESLEEIEPRFFCGCSRDKVESVLRMFETEELEDMLEKEGSAKVDCHFCGESYLFGKGEIQSMIRQGQTGRA